MNTEDLKELLDVSSEQERVELTIFYNSYLSTLKSYQGNPTKANKQNMDAARDGLDKKSSEIREKYLKSVAPAFQSTLQVLHHLYEAGYKISDSKIYRDKKAGLLKVSPDGTVAEAEVRAYAATLARRDGNIDDLSDLQQRKADKEIRLLEIKEKKMLFELEKEQGKYIPSRDVEAELASRAVVLDSGFSHLFSVRAREWIALVGGKVEKTADFLQALNAGKDEQLNQYASTRTWHVMFSGEE